MTLVFRPEREAYNHGGLIPQLSYFEMGTRTKDISNRIPTFPVSETLNSFETKSMLGEMRMQANQQAQAIHKNESQAAMLRLQSSESGTPFQLLQQRSLRSEVDHTRNSTVIIA